MTIKAIETVYKGYRFRSRLEARWAVFFDALGIEWEYEKEGFESKGIRYLPDFWLPSVSLRGGRPGVWVEIKPDDAAMKVDEGKYSAAPGDLVVFTGLPSTDWNSKGYQISPWWDNFMVIEKCYNETCGAVKIEYAEGNYMNCAICGGSTDNEHPVITAAVAAAKSARFEHGESGGY